MAVIRINKDVVWGSAAWLLDNVLERTSEILLPINAAFAKKLESSVRMTFFSLMDASEQEMQLFLQAVRQMENEYAQAGPASFADSSFYPGFMARVEELRLMLTADSRSGGTQ